MNTFETVTDVLEGHFSSTHSTVSGIKKQTGWEHQTRH